MTKPIDLDALLGPVVSTMPRVLGMPAIDYDRIVVAFSGGKDSLACLLYLLEAGVPKEKIELWHHRIDPEGQPMMDWPCTAAYCEAIAEAFDLPLLFSWKEGGFEREMLRKDALTAPTSFQTPSGEIITSGGISGKPSTRRKFPQVSADLSVRWCSAYLKIDVAKKVFSNDPRFSDGRFLMVTGERAEESSSRARYAEAEVQSETRRRRVVQWRPVHGWDEAAVWAIIARHGVLPHPAYRLGFGRVSCMACIFGNASQWATVRYLSAAMFEKIANYETEFGTTIKRSESVRDAARKGELLFDIADPSMKRLVTIAMSEGPYGEAVIVEPRRWTMPAGAFRKTGGPT